MLDNNKENVIKEDQKLLAGELIKYLKDEFRWFSIRWDTFEIKHKQVMENMLAKTPSICLHVAEVLRKNIGDDGLVPDDVWRCSSQEMDLLLLLALPYDDSEFVLTDDTGLVDISGKKILRAQ